MRGWSRFILVIHVLKYSSSVLHFYVQKTAENEDLPI